MQAALKGISITRRQAGPYVVVTSLGDISRLVPCAMTARALVEIYWPTLCSTSLLETHIVHMCRFDNKDCLLQEQSHKCFSKILKVFLCDAFDDNEQKWHVW